MSAVHAGTGERLIEDLQKNPGMAGSSENSGVIIVVHGNNNERIMKINQEVDKTTSDARLRTIYDLHRKSQEDSLLQIPKKSVSVDQWE